MIHGHSGKGKQPFFSKGDHSHFIHAISGKNKPKARIKMDVDREQRVHRFLVIDKIR
jgi:hypothetical protein